jgi:hypothetical protein
MVIGDTLTLDAVSTPANVELIDDLDTVIASLTPPRLQIEADEEIEEETEIVGEDGEAVEASGEEAGGDEAGSGAE